MVFSKSFTDLVVDNYNTTKVNSAEFFDKTLSVAYDGFGVYFIRKDLLDKEAERLRAAQPAVSKGAPPRPSALRQSIYVQTPGLLERTTREIMDGDNYKAAKDFVLHNFKITLFNVLTAVMITNVMLVVLGLSSLTVPVLAGFAIQAMVRDMLDTSIENGNKKVSLVGKALAAIDNKLFTGNDWYGGNKAAGFFRTWAPYPQLRSAFVWH